MFFGHFLIQKLLRVFLLSLALVCLVMQVRRLRVQVDVRELVQLLGELALERGELIDLVVFIPRVTVLLRVEVRVTVALPKPNSVKLIFVFKCVAPAQLLEVPVLFEAFAELFHDVN